MYEAVKSWLRWKRLTEEEYRARQVEILKQAPVPLFWLFGKTGSGKTSIVKFLTGAPRAEIGSGFAPQTKHSSQYDFPSSENPVMRFLDTRGLGETRYDPAEDIKCFAAAAHLMIVTVRVMDHALEAIVDPLRKIRAAQPERPVLLALTCLHEAYPQRQHPAVDPFADGILPAGLPDELQRSLTQQLQRFEGLVDRVVPIDFTRVEEGFHVPHFGGDRLKATLLELLPASYRQTVIQFDAAMDSLGDLLERRTMPLILGYSTLAATAAAVPMPWVDIPVVMALQSHLIYKLAAVYHQTLDRQILANTVGALGARLLGRMALQEALKVIPYVGMAANAAFAFMATFATGKASCWYFGQLRRGNAPTQQEIQQIWNEQLSQAAALWKRTHAEQGTP